jgi:hypothetical protein
MYEDKWAREERSFLSRTRDRTSDHCDISLCRWSASGKFGAKYGGRDGRADGDDFVAGKLL